MKPAKNAIPYEAVAEIVAANPTCYAPVIAERYEVLVTTAQCWVREAQRLGLLPDGEPA
jgi:hypothetical protein